MKPQLKKMRTSGTAAPEPASRRAQSVDVEIGRHIRRRREELGLSLDEVSRQCGVCFQQIQKYEAGTNRIPASRLFDLARALRTTATELLMAPWRGSDDDILRARLDVASQTLHGESLQSLVTLAELLAGRASADR